MTSKGFGRRGVRVGLSVAPAYAEDLVFTLNNQSSGAVNELYVWTPDSTPGARTFSARTSDSGQTATDHDPQCRRQLQWDIRIVYDDASVTDERNIDLCNLDDGTYDVTTDPPPVREGCAARSPAGASG